MSAGLCLSWTSVKMAYDLKEKSALLPKNQSIDSTATVKPSQALPNAPVKRNLVSSTLSRPVNQPIENTVSSGKSTSSQMVNVMSVSSRSGIMISQTLSIKAVNMSSKTPCFDIKSPSQEAVVKGEAFHNCDIQIHYHHDNEKKILC